MWGVRFCQFQEVLQTSNYEVTHIKINHSPPGWKKLVFFDMEEREITNKESNLVNLQKMALQWKIAVDFKPTASAGLNHGPLYTPLLIVTFGFGDFELRLQYRKDNIALMLFDPRKPRQPRNLPEGTTKGNGGQMNKAVYTAYFVPRRPKK